MAPNYKIALIQLHPKPLDPAFNFQKASSFIASAASQGAHLAVLPEYHLTSWVPESPQFRRQCADWEIWLKKYQDLAKEYHICIVPGTIVQFVDDPASPSSSSSATATNGDNNDDNSSKILINVAYFISPLGHILGSYQKKNLWHPERPHLTSSTSTPHTTISTPLGPVGLLICWDIAFPEAFRELIASGAKLIIVPTFWALSDCSAYGLRRNPLSEEVFLEGLLVARAFENTCGVVFVNAGAEAGKGDEGSWAGMSRVCMPFLGAVKGDQGEGEGGGMLGREERMSVVEVDMEDVEEAEKNYRVREDMGRDGWHYTYRHQQQGGKL